MSLLEVQMLIRLTLLTLLLAYMERWSSRQLSLSEVPGCSWMGCLTISTSDLRFFPRLPLIELSFLALSFLAFNSLSCSLVLKQTAARCPFSAHFSQRIFSNLHGDFCHSVGKHLCQA